jgi:putative NADPH-quinone reductase
MNVLIIDGHPDNGRLTTVLLDHYEKSLPPGVAVTRFAVRDMAFDPVLKQGYGAEMPWEPDLQLLAAALEATDHIVLGFPLWWGSEPAPLTGLFSRILLPGYAFRYHRENIWWDRLLTGRSADAIITMDTPPWYLALAFGDPIGHRLKHQVFGFCGVRPVRIFRLGPNRRGETGKRLEDWKARLAKAAATAEGLKRGVKKPLLAGRTPFAAAIREREGVRE